MSLRELFARLPGGGSEVAYDGRRYGVTRTVRLGGRQQSVANPPWLGVASKLVRGL